ncbi:O-antigen ligase family protein [Sulfurovum sp. XTW-4]|uniref:O-antigen ligase family protein n=1 Tax=Sulfurovum xiamenensis TaxID=3019066 RepID=A0ABT7QPR3_9BACT|nr:O-antigen ligase family protein [Sulfurovum xiamenensis]MDM5263078.1 O-antigen ligase family protein [Sulfurovum xiamenensis]
MIKKYSFLQIKEDRKSLFLTAFLSIILFWIGLGIGDNMSDFRFWIDNTWMTVKLEWLFVIVYIIITAKLPSLYILWGKYRFVTLIAALWLITVTLSYFISPYYSWQNPLAFMRYAETISHFIFFLFLWDFFNRYRVDYRIIFSSIILSTLVVMSYFIYIHFTFPDLKADLHVFSIRSDKLVLNTHIHRIGYQVETTIAFAIAFLFSKNHKYISIILIGALFLFLLWLGGRASILGIVVSLLVMLFYFRQKFSLKIFIYSGVIITLLGFMALYFNFLDLSYFTHALKKTFQAGSLEHLMSGRIQVWSLVIKELHTDWLLGAGPQSYFFYPDRHPDVIHAHNWILQMLGEWGLVGTGLFGILFYHAIRYSMIHHLRQVAYTNPYNLVAGLVILSLTITGLFSGTYFFHQTSVYLALAFSLWVSPSDIQKSNC